MNGVDLAAVELEVQTDVNLIIEFSEFIAKLANELEVRMVTFCASL